MGNKRWSKQKSGQQSAKQRKSRAQAGSSSTSTGGGGAVGGMRKMMKAVAGTGKSKKGPKSPVEKFFDVALWIAVIAAVAFAISKQCG